MSFHSFVQGHFPFCDRTGEHPRYRHASVGMLPAVLLDHADFTLRRLYELFSHVLALNSCYVYGGYDIRYHLPVDAFPQMRCCSRLIHHFNAETKIKQIIDKGSWVLSVSH